jgi:hypothetical protein
VDIVKRILSGEAPAQLPNLLTDYFNLALILGAKTPMMVITSGGVPDEGMSLKD